MSWFRLQIEVVSPPSDWVGSIFVWKVLGYDGTVRIHPRRIGASGDAGADQYAAGGFGCRGGSAAVAGADSGGSLRLPLLHPDAGAGTWAGCPELAAVRLGSPRWLRFVAGLSGVAP